MLRYLLLPLTLFFAASAWSSETFSTKDGLERQSVAFTAPLSDNTEWHEGWNMPLLAERIVEWVPKGESVHNWSRMVTLQFLRIEVDISATMLANRMEVETRGVVPEVQWEILEANKDHCLYHWAIPHNTEFAEVQSEICHLIRGQGGWFRIAYTHKVATLPQEELERWSEALGKAKIN